MKYKSKLCLLVQIFGCSCASADQVLGSCIFPAFARKVKKSGS